MKSIQILAVALVAAIALPSCVERQNTVYVPVPETKTVYHKTVTPKPKESAENFEAVH